MKINDGVTVTLGETICRFVEWDYIASSAMCPIW